MQFGGTAIFFAGMALPTPAASIPYLLDMAHQDTNLWSQECTM